MCVEFKKRISLSLRAGVCVMALTAFGATGAHAHVSSSTAAPAHESAAMIPADANMGKGAQNFIDNMATRGIEFLGNPKMDEGAKKKEFAKLLRDSFDMETIGRFALGTSWRRMTEAQRKEYLGLFREMVINVYSARFSDYKGQKFETRSNRTIDDKDTLVTSFIVPADGPEVQVDWRVRYKDGRYRVIDVIVEGVSMSVTQRSDFAAVIQRGGGDVQVLLAHLRGQN
jgi:phospholipid transport system substrate-binding protein